MLAAARRNCKNRYEIAHLVGAESAQDCPTLLAEILTTAQQHAPGRHKKGTMSAAWGPKLGDCMQFQLELEDTDVNAADAICSRTHSLCYSELHTGCSLSWYIMEQYLFDIVLVPDDMY